LTENTAEKEVRRSFGALLKAKPFKSANPISSAALHCIMPLTTDDIRIEVSDSNLLPAVASTSGSKRKGEQSNDIDGNEPKRQHSTQTAGSGNDDNNDYDYNRTENMTVAKDNETMRDGSRGSNADDATQRVEQLETAATAPRLQLPATLIASGSVDGLVQIIDPNLGTECTQLKDKDEFLISCCQFSPDNSILATGSTGECVTFWDMATLTPKLILEGHECMIKGISFSSDGTRLASCSSDKTIRVWDCATGVEQLCIRGHNDDVNAVCFSRSCKFLASGSHDKLVKIWDSFTGAEVRCMQGHEDAIYRAAYSPDDKILATSSFDNTVRLWDPAEGVELRRLSHKDCVTSVSFNCDGRRLVSSGADGSVKVWCVATGELEFDLVGHTQKVSCALFSPDDSEIASVSGGDESVRFWNAQTGELLRTMPAWGPGAVSFAYTQNQYFGIWSRDR
jgi:predicted NACHT family NTPase